MIILGTELYQIQGPSILSNAFEQYYSNDHEHSLNALAMYILYRYGPQAFILFVLIGITIWRKELSCNHVYHPPDASRSQGRTRLAMRSRVRHDHAFDRPRGHEEQRNGQGRRWAANEFIIAPILAMTCRVYDQISSHGVRHLVEELVHFGLYSVLFSFLPGVIVKKYRSNLSGYSRYEDNATDDSSVGHQASKNNDGVVDMEKWHKSLEDDGQKIFIDMLPTDIQLNIFTYLTARDICDFGCSSKACFLLTDDTHEKYGGSNNGVGLSSPARHIWNNVLCRDFRSLFRIEVAKSAFLRSMKSIHPNGLDVRMKTFDIAELLHSRNMLQPNRSRKRIYFEFTESWMNWTIAGENSEERCLVGLHGSILDMAPFLNEHPGTPETLRVQAGRCCTKYFEDIGHSYTARIRALDCVLLNRNELYHEIDFLLADESIMPFPMRRSKPWKCGNLAWVRRSFELEQELQKLKAKKWLNVSNNKTDVLGDEIHLFYDAFQGKWKWWYTNWDLRPIFVQEWRQ